jgi:hypothetical protein
MGFPELYAINAVELVGPSASVDAAMEWCFQEKGADLQTIIDALMVMGFTRLDAFKAVKAKGLDLDGCVSWSIQRQERKAKAPPPPKSFVEVVKEVRELMAGLDNEFRDIARTGLCLNKQQYIRLKEVVTRDVLIRLDQCELPPKIGGEEGQSDPEARRIRKALCARADELVAFVTDVWTAQSQGRVWVGKFDLWSEQEAPNEDAKEDISEPLVSEEPLLEEQFVPEHSISANACSGVYTLGPEELAGDSKIDEDGDTKMAEAEVVGALIVYPGSEPVDCTEPAASRPISGDSVAAAAAAVRASGNSAAAVARL